VIDRLEMLTMLNTGCCAVCQSEKIDDICDALTAGTLFPAYGDSDTINGLRITEPGRTYLPPTLPTATA